MGAFEDFVNIELPMRISTHEDGAGTGNLPPNKILKTTGIGLGVVTAEEGAGNLPTLTTVLTVTGRIDAGGAFFVNSGGTNYAKEGDDGDLGVDATEFRDNERIQIYLNGSNIVKGEHVMWASSTSFLFGFAVDPGDFIKIIS